MIESKQISPHVTSFIEADITNVANGRLKIKEDFLKNTILQFLLIQSLFIVFAKRFKTFTN